MIPTGVPFVLGMLTIATLFVVESAPRPCSCGNGNGQGHEHDCTWWPRRPPDPLDDPYARGRAEDRYYDALIGEGR